MSSNRFGWRALGATLLAALLVNTSASAATIFSDDFENDTINSNPVNPDIGLPWDNEKSPGVTVVANPNTTGNASAQVLQLHNKGEMDGNLSTGILFDGATLSTNFYIGSAVTGNKITIKFRRADGTGPFNLNLKQNGGPSAAATIAQLRGENS